VLEHLVARRIDRKPPQGAGHCKASSVMRHCPRISTKAVSAGWLDSIIDVGAPAVRSYPDGSGGVTAHAYGKRN